MRYVELRVLAVISCIAHAALAIGLWGDIGVVSKSSAAQIMDQLFPQWVWPTAFALVSFAAGMTVFSGARWMRRSFYLASALMFVWSGVTFIAWWQHPNNPQPTAFWLFHIGAVKFILARYVLARERLALLANRVVALGEEVARESGRVPTGRDGPE